VGLTKDDVHDILDVYIRAWEQQDPDLIVTIFTKDATYHERVLEAPIPDREAIRAYWKTKVIEGQSNILVAGPDIIALDGDTAVAEWEAEFDDVAKGVRKHMKEIAVLEFDGHLIRSLREYWSSQTIGAVAVAEQPVHAGRTRRG